jgi:two-component system, sensor histidine kinase and response regulator
VVWVALALLLLFASRSPHPLAMYLLLLAVVCHPIADAIYSWQVIQDTYTTGTAVAIGWIFSYAFFGAATLHPSVCDLSEDAHSARPTFPRWRLMLLAAAALMAPGLLLGDAIRGEKLDIPLTIGLFVLFILVLLRLAGLLRENERTMVEVRRLNESLEERVEERTAQLQSTVEDLRESKARTELVLEAASDGIWEWDIRTNEEYWNESHFELLGLLPDQVTPNFDLTLSLVHPEDRARLMENLNNSLERGGEYYQELRMRHASGKYRVYAHRAKVRRDENGAPVRLAGTVTDITEQKEYEQNLHNARITAEEASRAKSEFLANMSHEIRTPMNGVIGMTGLLLDTDLNSEQHEYAETVRISGENLLTIINDILDFSKIEAGKLELEMMDFDLQRVVEETVDLLAEQARNKGLELATLIEQSVPIGLRGDPGRIRQILVNILSNAVKFTEEGEVVLRTSLAEESSKKAIIRFEVRDTGIGMTEEQRSRLFDNFSQADASTTRRFGGTGLGLAISKQLVEMMGGEIGVKSELGRGSTFFFTVILEKQAEEPTQRSSSRREDLANLRVLVVDDNETNRKIVHEHVISWGMKNGMAGDGQSALKLLREVAQSGEPYDLAILDLDMPGMDGMELASRIKAEPSIASTHLILLTSMGLRGEAEQARSVGFSAYLTKPVRQSRLLDTIAVVMGAEPGEGETKTRYEGAPIVTRHSLEEAKAHGRSRVWRAHVLVAEDNAVNQKVAVRMLERLGYRADVAANGLEAIEALSRIPYAAVLMDVQMPEMDGYEATAKIRRREGDSRHTPIIAMTANAMQGDREKALEAGMDDYIPKPVNPDKLKAVLERWALKLEKAIVLEAGDSSATMEDQQENAVDRNVLADIRELQGEGEPDMLAEMIELFLVDVPPRLVALKEAAEAGDTHSVELISHALKGSTASMGAVRMEALCTELEQMGRSEDLSAALGQISLLEEEFRQVRKVFEEEFSKN